TKDVPPWIRRILANSTFYDFDLKAFGSEKNKVRINPGRVGAVKGIREHECESCMNQKCLDSLYRGFGMISCRIAMIKAIVEEEAFTKTFHRPSSVASQKDLTPLFILRITTAARENRFESPSAGKFGLARQAEVRANKDVGKNQRLILRPILARRFVRRARQDLQAHALENPFEWRPVDEPSSFSAIGLFPLPCRVVVTHFVPQANRVPRFV
ncbi:hypothetical protein V1477_010077, partial [Vespula maculifrons]